MAREIWLFIPSAFPYTSVPSAPNKPRQSQVFTRQPMAQNGTSTQTTVKIADIPPRYRGIPAHQPPSLMRNTLRAAHCLQPYPTTASATQGRRRVLLCSRPMDNLIRRGSNRGADFILRTLCGYGKGCSTLLSQLSLQPA